MSLAIQLSIGRSTRRCSTEVEVSSSISVKLTPLVTRPLRPFSARFLDMMVDKLPDGVAQFGKSLRTYTLDSTGRPALHFADGTTASADVLIACDGIKSNVRPVMLADVLPKQLKPRFTGTTVYRSLSPMDEIVKKIGDKARQSTSEWSGLRRPGC